MCGMYIHGFYWKDEGANGYTVAFDFEINSHAKIKEHRDIPKNAIRIGVNPINGIATASNSLTLPSEVKERAEMLFHAYYPSKELIARWLKDTYGKQYDQGEWELPLLQMLSDGGIDLFSVAYFKQKIKDYDQWIKDNEKWIKDGVQRIKDPERWIKNNEKWIKYCEQRVKDYEQWMKDCEKWIKDCTGTLTTMEIDRFVPYFLAHPNAFWAKRNEERKVEYKNFVTA